jgi:sortase (surface protein transpeptidase)
VPRLTLVTCYPFDAIEPGGPLRYVVTAELAKDPITAPEPALAAVSLKTH